MRPLTRARLNTSPSSNSATPFRARTSDAMTNTIRATAEATPATFKARCSESLDISVEVVCRGAAPGRTAEPPQVVVVRGAAEG